MLAAFASGRVLDRFAAYADLADAVLPSTVAKIECRGIVVSRQAETVMRGGRSVRCCRYWLEPAERAKAVAFLMTDRARAARSDDPRGTR